MKPYLDRYSSVHVVSQKLNKESEAALVNLVGVWPISSVSSTINQTTLAKSKAKIP